MAGVVNINDLLDGHVALDLECLDRIYLNAYVPNLQVGGQVVRFLTEHLGNPIPSPALFARIGDRFRAAVTAFAEASAIPVVRFAKDARKADVMRPYLEAAKEPGVVAIGPADIERFFARWMARIPTPLGAADRAAGYWWELSMRQVEVSRTIVFDAPRRARSFFEALVTDNLDLGRPDEVALIFDRRVQANTPGTFSTRVVTRGTEVTVNVFYKHSRIKEYLKEGRALRIETVVNGPSDLGCQRRLANLPELQTKARAANGRLLIIQRVGQGCAIATELFERVALPSFQEGQRTGALRFGDPRVMALAGALCLLVHAVSGFTNRSLRAQVAALLGVPYTSGQMTYDLRRLRRKGLIRRLDHANTYVPTPEGIRVAICYTKLHDRLLGPLLAADHPPAPPELRNALRVVDRSIDDYVARARLKTAA